MCHLIGGRFFHPIIIKYKRTTNRTNYMNHFDKWKYRCGVMKYIEYEVFCSDILFFIMC